MNDMKVTVNNSAKIPCWKKWPCAFLLSVVFFVANLVAIDTYFKEDFHASSLKQRQKVIAPLSIIRSRIESFLNGDLSQVKGLIGLPMSNSDIDEKLFSRVASELAADSPHIKSLQLAPNGVVTYVWPYEENKAAIGHDLFADPQRILAANKAIDSRYLWIAGPVNLKQGGVAIIGRYPIFIYDPKNDGEKFWGFASILLNWESVIQSARFYAEQDQYIQFGIRGKDGLGAEGEQMFGQPEVFINSPIIMDIVLPGGLWQLGAIPTTGWLSPDSYKLELKVGLGIVALLLSISMFALLGLPVSLRKKIEEATQNLVASEDRLVDALESIPDAFAIFDASNNLVHCNNNFKVFYQQCADIIEEGVPVRTLIEHGLTNHQYMGVSKAASSGELLKQLHEKLEQHNNCENHFEEELSDGRVLRVTQRRMRDGGLAGIRVDITDLKNKEKELRASKLQADAANEAKSIFLATVSHELRTPLNVVIGVLTALEQSPLLPEKEVRKVSVANRSGRHLLSLVNEILDLSQIESGEFGLEVQAFTLNELLKPVLSFAEFNAEQNDLEFKFEKLSSVPECWSGDVVRIRQILFNLLSNAIKFTKTGKVQLTLTQASASSGASELIFNVDDTGPGVCNSLRSKLFQEFSQAEKFMIREQGGAGLGLAISRKLARICGGNIEYVDSPLGGARFTLTIPLAQQEPEPIKSSKSNVDVSTIIAKSTKRILVVDDSKTNQMVIECLLEGEGHELYFADGGLEAIEMCKRMAFDIILMDIAMPGINGIQTTMHIRNFLQEACPLIVAVTAHAMIGDRESYLQQGLDGFIAKPVDKCQLLRIIS